MRSGTISLFLKNLISPVETFLKKSSMGLLLWSGGHHHPEFSFFRAMGAQGQLGELKGGLETKMPRR